MTSAYYLFGQGHNVFKKKGPNMDDLNYEWLPNLSSYEARIMLGLTAQEAMMCAMGFIVTISIFPSVSGAILALLAVLAILLVIKKIDRFGQKSCLIYLVMRIWGRINKKQIEIPLIMGGNSGRIELENWEGEIILTLDDF